jgi:hypothetical protein
MFRALTMSTETAARVARLVACGLVRARLRTRDRRGGEPLTVAFLRILRARKSRGSRLSSRKYLADSSRWRAASRAVANAESREQRQRIMVQPSPRCASILSLPRVAISNEIGRNSRQFVNLLINYDRHRSVGLDSRPRRPSLPTDAGHPWGVIGPSRRKSEAA